MKFTIVFTTLLCISTSWAVLAKKVEDPKDKREAGVGYGSPALSGHSYGAPALGQGDASSVSVGAGYSIGGAKPSYSFGQGSGALSQYSGEGLSQLSHSLGSGGISLQPSTTVAEFHQGGDGAQIAQGGQEYAFPQFSYAAPKQQQFVLGQEQLQHQLTNAPSYSTGTKGLGSYSTGPVLFTPSESQSNAPAPVASYGAPSSGHSFADAGSLSLGGAGGHSLGGLAGLGGAGLTLGGAGHSFGGSYKQFSGGYAAPSKASFKPSAYLGSSVQGESSQGLSGHGIPSHSLSGSYGSPSFGSFRGAGHGGLSIGSSGHSLSFGGHQGGFGSGSSKFIAPIYQSAKAEGLDGVSAFSSGHAAPPSTTYGFPSSSFSSNNAHAASSNRPYYVPKHHHHSSPSSFGEGSSAYRAPVSGHSSLSSFSSGPKYSFGGSSSHYAPKDAHGAASETSYNTIKYSEELKPRAH